MNSFPGRLLRLFYESGMSQSKLSIELGMSGAHFHNLMNGKRKPTIKSLVTIAEYFDVSLDWLLGRTDQRSIR